MMEDVEIPMMERTGLTCVSFTAALRRAGVVGVGKGREHGQRWALEGQVSSYGSGVWGGSRAVAW